MKIVVQRVLQASVKVEDEVLACIDNGMLLFTCIELHDSAETMKKAAYKIANLRIFEDQKTKKMSLNLTQSKGSILNVSQFTLCWDGSKGHRPSFDKSMPPAKAKVLLRIFQNELTETFKLRVKEGRFAADMKVNLLNDGPVTFILNF